MFRRLLPLLTLLAGSAQAQLAPQNFRISLTPAGDVNSNYPDGDDGETCVWAPISDIAVANGYTGSVDLSEFVSGCSTPVLTLSCATPLPSGGWSFSAPNIVGAGTTTGSNSCQGAANGTALSTSFLLTSTGDDSDTLPPYPPSIASCTSTPTSITCDILPLADPTRADSTTSGLKEVRVTLNGTPHTTQSVSPGLISPIIRTSIGDSAGGSVNQAGGSFTLSASSSGDWYGTSDNLEYLSSTNSLSGDLDVIVHIPNWQHTAQWAKAAPHIRKSFAANSAGVWQPLYPSAQGRGTNLEYRSASGASASQQTLVSGVTAPECLRLSRRLNIFTTYTSPNCHLWEQHQTQSIALPDPVYAGAGLGQLGVNAGEVEFSILSINNLPTFQVTFTDLNPSTTYTIGVIAEDNGGNSSSHSTTTFSTTAPLDSPEWPRLCNIGIGGTPREYANDAAIKWMAVQDCVITNVWDGWQGTYGNGKTWGQVVDSIIVRSPLNTATKVWAYFEPQGIIKPPNSGADSEITAKFFANPSWLLWANGTSGTVVNNFWSSNMAQVNYWPGAATSGGLTLHQWHMRYALDVSYTGGSYGTSGGNNSAAPNIYGILLDNLPGLPGVCYPSCGYQGDFDRNGTTDDGRQEQWWPTWREGFDNYFTALNALAPTLKIAANTSQFAHPLSQPHRQPYIGRLQGGYLESMLGVSNSVETWAGFNDMKAAYARQESLMQPGYYAGFGQHLEAANGWDLYDSTPYRAAWYGMASAWVLGDAGYSGNLGTSHGYNITDRSWFDYYAVDSSRNPVTLGNHATLPAPTHSQLKWLGAALGPYQVLSGTGSIGLHIRFFEKGFCVVNPKGNGTQTLQTSHVGGAGLYARINGTQRPTWDNGATFNSGLSIPARDGICMPKVL